MHGGETIITCNGNRLLPAKMCDVKYVQEAEIDFTTFDFTWPASKKPVMAANKKPVMARQLSTRSLYWQESLATAKYILPPGQRNQSCDSLVSMCIHTTGGNLAQRNGCNLAGIVVPHSICIPFANLQQRQQRHQAQGLPSKSHMQLNLSSAHHCSGAPPTVPASLWGNLWGFFNWYSMSKSAFTSQGM